MTHVHYIFNYLFILIPVYAYVLLLKNEFPGGNCLWDKMKTYLNLLSKVCGHLTPFYTHAWLFPILLPQNQRHT